MPAKGQAPQMAFQIAALYFLFENVLHLLTEEAGWRGYALPSLQTRLRPFVASLLLGVLWAGWHVPLFLLQGTPQSRMPLAGFLASAVATTLLIT